jgi:hypothetical protein
VVWLLRHLLAECGSSFGPGFAPPPAAFATTSAAAAEVTLPASSPPPTPTAAAAPSSSSTPSSPSSSRTLSMDDIGVITPYRRQVVALRGALRAAGLGGVGVGTVLNYQGQEKRVVVLSTVLGGTYGTELARKQALLARAAAAPSPFPSVAATIAASKAAPPPPPPPSRPPAAGLLHDAQTFNVAVTRAQSLLVAVGDPAVWCGDPAWRALLQHAVDHGGYLGWAGAACPLGPSDASLWSSPAAVAAAAAAAPSSAEAAASSSSTAADYSSSSGGSGTTSTRTLPRARPAAPAAGVIGRGAPGRASPTGDAAPLARGASPTSSSPPAGPGGAGAPRPGAPGAPPATRWRRWARACPWRYSLASRRAWGGCCCSRARLQLKWRRLLFSCIWPLRPLRPAG